MVALSRISSVPAFENAVFQRLEVNCKRPTVRGANVNSCSFQIVLNARSRSPRAQAQNARSTRCRAAASDPSVAASPPALHSVVATPFHLAFPVKDLVSAREFYGEILGCPEGRSAKTWVDFSLFGHQIVCHVVPGYNAASTANAVDGDPVPVPHFGLAMAIDDFHALAARVRDAGIRFVIEPHVRFQGQPGEQWTMFFKDPSGNSLEFKAMTNPANLFAKYVVNE